MGAIYGGGSEEEIDAIGDFFEATGLAFQIIDDVLNLRGLVKPGEKMSQALKVVGEDITEGKVTAPIAKAMSLLKTKKERQEIWDIVKSKPKDQAVVDKCIAKLEACNAIEVRHTYERAFLVLLALFGHFVPLVSYMLDSYVRCEIAFLRRAWRSRERWLTRRGT